MALNASKEQILNGYEFDAPKWLDFERVDELDGARDSWFDTSAVNGAQLPLTE